MVTNGGIEENGKWHEVKRVSFDHLHREWQRQLFAMLEEQVKGKRLKELLICDSLNSN